MKEHHLMLSENGYEYIGNIYVTCNKIVRIDEKTLLLDKIKIEFDENIDIDGEIR